MVICWIPGHCGISGNERADSLARQTASGPVIPNGTFLVPPKDMALHSYRHSSLEVREEEDRKKALFSLITHRPRLPKAAISLYFRVLFQVARTPSYLYKIQQKDTPECECGQLGTINHIFFGCSLYSQHRISLLHELYAFLPVGPLHLPSILLPFSPRLCKSLFRYTTRIKMKL